MKSLSMIAIVPQWEGPAPGCQVLYEDGSWCHRYCGVETYMNTLAALLGSKAHGYDLRRRLNSALGPFRALSYGSLYPALRALTDRGLIAHVDEPGMNPLSTGARAAASARPRISPAWRARKFSM